MTVEAGLPIRYLGERRLDLDDKLRQPPRVEVRDASRLTRKPEGHIRRLRKIHGSTAGIQCSCDHLWEVPNPDIRGFMIGSLGFIVCQIYLPLVASTYIPPQGSRDGLKLPTNDCMLAVGRTDQNS